MNCYYNCKMSWFFRLIFVLFSFDIAYLWLKKKIRIWLLSKHLQINTIVTKRNGWSKVEFPKKWKAVLLACTLLWRFCELCRYTLPSWILFPKKLVSSALSIELSPCAFWHLPCKMHLFITCKLSPSFIQMRCRELFQSKRKCVPISTPHTKKECTAILKESWWE